LRSKGAVSVPEPTISQFLATLVLTIAAFNEACISTSKILEKKINT